MTDPAQAPHPLLPHRRSAPIGVIGGSGFYSFLDDAAEVSVPTPFGEPSGPVTLGAVGGREVAFIARHGSDHRFPPHRVNYRANLWALRAVGVRQVLAPCAVGSLRAENGPGTIVLPDQVVDRTWGREHTVYDAEGPVVHVSMADPYCPRGRRAVLAVAPRRRTSRWWTAARSSSSTARASPAAPSRSGTPPRAGPWSGMTGMPEASIARELALCLTSIALVTDLDAGVEEGAGRHPPRGAGGVRAQRRAAEGDAGRGGADACRTTTSAPAGTPWTASACRSTCREGRAGSTGGGPRASSGRPPPVRPSAAGSRCAAGVPACAGGWRPGCAAAAAAVALGVLAPDPPRGPAPCWWRPATCRPAPRCRTATWTVVRRPVSELPARALSPRPAPAVGRVVAGPLRASEVLTPVPAASVAACWPGDPPARWPCRCGWPTARPAPCCARQPHRRAGRASGRAGAPGPWRAARPCWPCRAPRPATATAALLGGPAGRRAAPRIRARVGCVLLAVPASTGSGPGPGRGRRPAVLPDPLAA